jgi:Zn-dependent protease/CBS domain-containing protein
MRGSVKIANLFGIPVFIHWSFWLLFFFVAYISTSFSSIAFNSVYVLALFVCVVMHEFGHALSARFYGVSTQDITILPIGGVARLDKMPEKPLQEFVVAIAGPAVNVVIALVLGLIVYGSFSFQLGAAEIRAVVADGETPINMLFTLLISNIGLVVFNMIPAFPMDGGRVFRALLSIRLGRSRATYIASIFGQVISVGFIIFALLPLLRYVFTPYTDIGMSLTFIWWKFQPVLALISVFIFTTARNEYKSVRMDEIMSRHTVVNVLRPHFTRLKTSDLMQTASTEMAKGVESNFLVFDDADILRGVLQDDDILDAAKNKHYDALVFTYMTHELKKISPFDSIKDVYYKMLETGQYLMPVMQNDTVTGVVDMVMLQNFIKFQEKVKAE